MTRSPSDPLYIDRASHKAARYACEQWHYSKCLPVGKLVKIGIWERSKFKGVIVYGRGASPWLLHRYDLDRDQGCELVRIALRDHEHPVSQMLAYSLKLLQEKCPGLRIVVSFADPRQGHHGGVYQAANWYYLGRSDPNTDFLIHDEVVHTRSVGAKYGTTNLQRIQQQVDPAAKRVRLPGKHRYAWPLDEDMRRLLEAQQEPYPRPHEDEPYTVMDSGDG